MSLIGTKRTNSDVCGSVAAGVPAIARIGNSVENDPGHAGHAIAWTFAEKLLTLGLRPSGAESAMKRREFIAIIGSAGHANA